MQKCILESQMHIFTYLDIHIYKSKFFDFEVNLIFEGLSSFNQNTYLNILGFGQFTQQKVKYIST